MGKLINKNSLFKDIDFLEDLGVAVSGIHYLYRVVLEDWQCISSDSIGISYFTKLKIYHYDVNNVQKFSDENGILIKDFDLEESECHYGIIEYLKDEMFEREAIEYVYKAYYGMRVHLCVLEYSVKEIMAKIEYMELEELRNLNIAYGYNNKITLNEIDDNKDEIQMKVKINEKDYDINFNIYGFSNEEIIESFIFNGFKVNSFNRDSVKDKRKRKEEFEEFLSNIKIINE